MKFTVPFYTRTRIELRVVEVIDVTYCRNHDGHLVTTLFCIATESDSRFDEMPVQDFKDYQKAIKDNIKGADSYTSKLKYAEAAIEVRGDYYYAIKNRYGNKDSQCELYKG